MRKMSKNNTFYNVHIKDGKKIYVLDKALIQRMWSALSIELT